MTSADACCKVRGVDKSKAFLNWCQHKFPFNMRENDVNDKVSVFLSKDFNSPLNGENL